MTTVKTSFDVAASQRELAALSKTAGILRRGLQAVLAGFKTAPAQTVSFLKHDFVSGAPLLSAASLRAARVVFSGNLSTSHRIPTWL